ncbi:MULTISPECIES: LysR family transcriptional regulator [unclassified Kribbella]|uniref:LysR family transcriptional regulator n=1 Tax=unclassified Kribbella TaxID=2644121 RepID=UPI0030166E42
MSTSSRLNLTQVATLREFVRRGTLAAAAEHLGYTAGAVSQHVAALEQALEVPLLQRSGRQLVLTDAGRIMADYANRLLALEAEAIAVTRSSYGKAAGPLLVGTWGSTAVGLLAPIVERMEADHPEVMVASREVDVDEAAASVRHGDVDIAFGLDYADAPMPHDAGLTVVELHSETFVVAIAATDPPRAEVALAELDWILPPETSQFGRAVRAGLRRHGFEPRVLHEVTDTGASLQLAAAGLGATVMTDLMRRLNPTLDLVGLQLADPFSRKIVLITRGGITPRESVRVFIEVAQHLVAEMLE